MKTLTFSIGSMVLVRISKKARGKRNVKVPRVLFEEIALKIAI